MTMPTERSRASEAHRRYQASRDDSAMQEAARIQRAMSTDMPVMPTDEPVERETWRASFADYWQDVKPVVLCAMFVLTVLAFGAHVVGLWGA